MFDFECTPTIPHILLLLLWSHFSSSCLIPVSQVNDRFKLDWGTYLTTSKSFSIFVFMTWHESCYTQDILFCCRINCKWMIQFQMHQKPRREHHLWADWRQRVWFQGKIFMSSSSSALIYFLGWDVIPGKTIKVETIQSLQYIEIARISTLSPWWLDNGEPHLYWWWWILSREFEEYWKCIYQITSCQNNQPSKLSLGGSPVLTRCDVSAT